MRNSWKILTLVALTTLISQFAVAQNSKVIVQLKDASQDSFWFPATDKIRFGENGSTAFMSVDWNKGQGSFFGELKINENAGFASYRVDQELDLSNFKKLQIPVRGDGREYKILVKDLNSLNSPNDYSYQASFKTRKDTPQRINLKLSDFKPVYRGVIDTNLPPLNKEEIVQLGIQINDGQPGPYKIEFKEWIAK